jgi:hypothetical protein
MAFFTYIIVIFAIIYVYITANASVSQRLEQIFHRDFYKILQSNTRTHRAGIAHAPACPCM